MFGITTILPAGAGALVALSLVYVWLGVWHDPRVTQAARAEYVAIAQLEAATAQAAEMERQRNAASQAFEEYRLKLDAVLKQEAVEDKQQEALIADYERRMEAAGRAWLLDEDDKAFLEK